VRADEQEPNKRRECRTSERLITKSISIKYTGRRFGGCALKVVELTSGELTLVAGSPEGTETDYVESDRHRTQRQQSAEGIVGGKRAGTSRKDSFAPKAGTKGAASRRPNLWE
jgi:hypothetical protein